MNATKTLSGFSNPSFGKAAKIRTFSLNFGGLFDSQVVRKSQLTHVIFEPLDFMAHLAALVPRTRVNLARYHGVFAPNSPHWALVTKAARGRGAKREVSDEVEEDTPAARRSAMT